MKKEEIYKARVVAAYPQDEKIEIAFIYYGSCTGTVHVDPISTTSHRYSKARKLKVGDEVYAAPQDDDKIYDFVFHNPLKRLYVRTIKAFSDGW